MKQALRIVEDTICSLRQVVLRSFVWRRIELGDVSFLLLCNGSDFLDSLDRYKSYEPPLAERFLRECGSAGSFIDIGCSFGYYTLLAAHLLDTSKIHCFDRSKSALWALQKSFKHAGLPLPSMHRYFVGRSDTKPDQTSIDSFLATREFELPLLIKMDIEGHELAALEGMRDSLSSLRPRLIIEIHPRRIIDIASDGIDKISDVFEQANYALQICRNHRGPHRGSLGEWESCTLDDFRAFCHEISQKGGNFAISASAA